MDVKSNFSITDIFYNQLKTANQILTADITSTKWYCFVTFDDGILVIFNASSLVDGRR